jgi:hypothetical protein
LFEKVISPPITRKRELMSVTGSVIVAKLFSVLIGHDLENSMGTVLGTVAHGFLK